MYHSTNTVFDPANGGWGYTLTSMDTVLWPNDGRITLGYRSASGAFTLNYRGEFTTYGADARAQEYDKDEVFRYTLTAPNLDQFTITRPYNNYRFVNFAWQTIEINDSPATGRSYRDIHRRYLVGSRTINSDIPTSGVFNYSIAMATSAVGPKSSSGTAVDGSLRFDYGTRKVSGSVIAKGAVWSNGSPQGGATLVLSGEISPQGNLMKGQISSTDSDYTGEFYGHAFGPQAAEAGFLITLAGKDGWKIVGQVIAKR